MNGTLHTFHKLSTDERRGTHAFTTQDAGEALTLSAAPELRRRLGDLLAFSGLILGSIEQSHGEGRTLEAIRSAIAKGEDVLSRSN